MLKLTLSPPIPKRKWGKDKAAPEPSPYKETVSSLEMLLDRIIIIRQTATSAVKNDQAKAEGKGDAIG
ncbi:hypothetical protein RSOL_386650, partial [Rhizoctonia solani AG-3 Rhs1AP]